MVSVNLTLLKQFEVVELGGNVENFLILYSLTQERGYFSDIVIFLFPWNLPVCVCVV